MDGKVNINELTDEQIKTISEFADKLDNTDAPLKDKSPDNKKLEKGSGLVDDNGKLIPVLEDNDDPFDGVDLSQIEGMEEFDKLLNLSEDEIKEKFEIEPEAVKECGLLDPDALTDEDISELIKVVDRYRAGEEFSYYNSLPDNLKKIINATAGVPVYLSGAAEKKLLVKTLFDSIIQANYIRKVTSDMESMTNKELDKIYDNTKTEMKKYERMQREFFETTCIENANKLRETGEEANIEKAEQLEASSHSFEQSYTYEDMMAKFKTGKLKIKKIDIDKFDTRCKEFDFKYNNTKFIINTIADTVPILVKVFEDSVSEEQLKKFIIVFIKYSQNMKPDIVSDHIFMYYFIKHIISLPYANKDDAEEMEFYDTVKDNIHKFIEEAGL